MKLTEKHYSILERALKGHSQPGYLPHCRTLAKHGFLRLYEERSKQGADRVIYWSARITPEGRAEINRELARRKGPNPFLVAVRELLKAAESVVEDHSDSLDRLREDEGEEAFEDSEEINNRLREAMKKVEGFLKGTRHEKETKEPR